jgi:Zn-dependent M28 family amino/carboxypeptidase
MRKLFTVLVLVSALWLPLPSLQAQRKGDKTKITTPAASTATTHGADVITAAQMRAFLTFIASDEMEGRDTPSRGLDTVAQFISMNLTHWGFKPAGDNGTFLQRIALRRDRIDGAQTHAEFNGQTLVVGDDYIPGTGGSASGQLVFAGNGWFVKSKNWDPYQGIDAKGKIAVVYASPQGLPHGLRRTDLTGKQGEDWMNAAEYARKQGATGIIFVPDFQYLASWTQNRQRTMERGTTIPEKFMTTATAALPAIVISPRVANLLFQGSGTQAAPITATTLFEGAYGSGPMPASFALSPDKKFSLNVVVKNEIIPTQNVVAIWEGSDPLLKDEYVAVGAHYDHIGTAASGGCRPINGDTICNGADDDGSGTTAILAMAEAVSHATSRPKRSVLFVWHCGEEKGLWGSRYFTDNPTVSLDRVVAQLNIDMIGRSKKAGDTNPRNQELSGPNEIYVIGSTMMSTELGEWTLAVNKSFLNITYDLRYDDPKDPNRFFFRSDHFNYARKGIPIIFFFDGVHEDYHQAGDSPDKIDYQKMENITRTVYLTMWEVANHAARPKVDKPLPAQLTAN